MPRFIRQKRPHRVHLALVAFGYLAMALWLGTKGTSLGAEVWGSELSAMRSSSAVAILSAISSGMMAFTGIVFSLVFVGIQLGNTTYSPRLFDELGRHRLLAHAVGIFTGTFLYSLLAIRSVDLGDTEGISSSVAMVAFAWMIASVVVLLVLLPKVTSLTLPQVLLQLGQKGRVGVLRLYTVSTDPQRREAPHRRLPHRRLQRRKFQRLQLQRRARELPDSHREPLHTLVRASSDTPRYVVGFDEAQLVRIAQCYDVWIELPFRVGDPRLPGDVLAHVHGLVSTSALRQIHRAIWLAEERFTENDPVYAIQLLVDIAIRALSPAVNDPSTAVDVIPYLHTLLRDFYIHRQDEAVCVDEEGVVRVRFMFPAWEDVLCTATQQIGQYGADCIPVMQRLRALRDDLDDQMTSRAKSDPTRA